MSKLIRAAPPPPAPPPPAQPPKPPTPLVYPPSPIPAPPSPKPTAPVTTLPAGAVCRPGQTRISIQRLSGDLGVVHSLSCDMRGQWQLNPLATTFINFRTLK